MLLAGAVQESQTVSQPVLVAVKFDGVSVTENDRNGTGIVTENDRNGTGIV